MKSGHGDRCEDIWVQWRGQAWVSDHARLWLVIEGTKGDGKWDVLEIKPASSVYFPN